MWIADSKVRRKRFIASVGLSVHREWYRPIERGQTKRNRGPKMDKIFLPFGKVECLDTYQNSSLSLLIHIFQYLSFSILSSCRYLLLCTFLSESFFLFRCISDLSFYMWMKHTFYSLYLSPFRLYLGTLMLINLPTLVFCFRPSMYDTNVQLFLCKSSPSYLGGEDSKLNYYTVTCKTFWK